MKQHSTEFVGAILLSGNPGALNEVPLSQGAGVPPVWGVPVAASPALPVTQLGFGDAGGLLTGSARLTYVDASRAITLGESGNTGPVEIAFRSTNTSSALLTATSSARPNLQGGVIFPNVGGDHSQGPGIWWSDGTYPNTSGLRLSLGLSWQGYGSGGQSFKILQSTGTSATGDSVFEFRPNDGYANFSPYGLAADNTTGIRFLELFANGVNYVEFAAPDSIAANVRIRVPANIGSLNDLLAITAVSGSNITTGWITPAGSGIVSIGTIDSQSKAANGAVIVSGSSLVLQTADGTNPGLVSTGAQTFAGVKTFTSPPSSPGGSGSEEWGAGATASLSSAVALGTNAIAGSQCISIGNGATTSGATGGVSIGAGVIGASSTFVCGGSSFDITDVYFGSGIATQGTPDPVTIHGSATNLASQAGAFIAIAGGQGRGAGLSGEIRFTIAIPGAAAGTLNTLIQVANFDGALGNLRQATDHIFTVAGKGVQFQSGANQRAGNLTLIGGTLTVSNTTITANTLIHLTRKTSGGTIGTAITYTLNAGVGFTVNSDNILDTSTFTYLLTELN